MTLLSKIFILFNTEEWQALKMQRKKFYEERQHKTIIQNNLFTSYALLHLFSSAAPLFLYSQVSPCFTCSAPPRHCNSQSFRFAQFVRSFLTPHTHT